MRQRLTVPKKLAWPMGLAVLFLVGAAQAEYDWGRLPDAHWLVGTQTEFSHSNAPRIRAWDRFRVGVSVAYRHLAWGPHAKILVSPSTGTYEAFNGVAGGGLRAHFETAGVSWSYGVAISGEVRLLDHFWLAYATPAELGAVLFEQGSLRVSVLGGVRRAIAGATLNSVYLDPNGLDDSSARDDLHHLRSFHPWETFVSLDFARLL